MNSSRVFDGGNGGWFWVHDAVIDLYGSSIGPHALAVYMTLCRMSNKEGQAMPSKRTLATRCGMSTPSVYRALTVLVEHGLVSISKRVDADGQHSNLYTLLDYRAVKKPLADAAKTTDTPYHTDTPQYHTDTPPCHTDIPPMSHRHTPHVCVTPPIRNDNTVKEYTEKENKNIYADVEKFESQTMLNASQRYPLPALAKAANPRHRKTRNTVAGFNKFWDSLQDRFKVKREECLKVWQQKNYDEKTDMLIADYKDRVENDLNWQKFPVFPFSYLNNNRHEDYFNRKPAEYHDPWGDF